MSSHDNKLLLLIKTKGRIANISCHVCAVARLSGGCWSSIQLQPVGQPDWEPCHCLRQDNPLCIPGRALGHDPERAGVEKPPKLKQRCHFPEFYCFLCFGGLFKIKVGLIVEVLWNLGCTEAAHASPSAGTSWFCIVQGHFLFSGGK